MSDIKLYALNATSLALSFSQLDMVLKILLLVLDILLKSGTCWTKKEEIKKRNRRFLILIEKLKDAEHLRLFL